MKKHWKLALGAVAALLLIGALWYSRPVDIYTLDPALEGMDSILVAVSYNEPGQGITSLRSMSLEPGGDSWQAVLEQLEALRFRRPLRNLIRQYQAGYSFTGALTEEAHVVFHLIGPGEKWLMLQVGAGQPSYTSRHTGNNLPAALSGGEETAQALAERLWALLPEEEGNEPQ